MYRIQLVGILKWGGGQSVDLIFVGLTSYLQITPTTGFTLGNIKYYVFSDNILRYGPWKHNNIKISDVFMFSCLCFLRYCFQDETNGHSLHGNFTPSC